MGRPMAERLLAADFPVTAWNRTAAKAEPLRAQGATIAGSPAEAAAGADIICIIMENAASVEAVLFRPDVLAVLKPGSIVADMTSLHPAAARENAARLAKQGVAYLDAP